MKNNKDNTMHSLITTFIKNNPILRHMLALLFTSSVFAAPSISPIENNVFKHHLTETESIFKPLVTFVDIEIPKQKANISITTMFSAQHGSWPFESFAINNLFRIIATYQTNHPRMITIKNGTTTLKEINQQINNPKIIRPFQNGYLLSYPLLIEKGAALAIKNTSLYLYTPAGTAIINNGSLIIQNSEIQSWIGSINNNSAITFRPFIMNWAGSYLEIINSQISKLGYNAYLVQGITTSINDQQPSDTPKVQVKIENSQITDLSSLNFKHATLLINKSTISNAQQYGIDTLNSQFIINNNKIQHIKNNSGIRIQGDISGIIENNAILDTNKAAIEIHQAKGNLTIQDNLFTKNSRHGLLITEIDGHTTIFIKKNLFTHLTGTAIEANEFKGSTYILENTIQNTPEYAISFRNLTKQPDANLIIYNNKMIKTRKPLIRTIGIGHILLGHNNILGSAFYQNLLVGDLLPFQGILLEGTLKYQCILEINFYISTTNNLDFQHCQ